MRRLAIAASAAARKPQLGKQLSTKGQKDFDGTSPTCNFNTAPLLSAPSPLGGGPTLVNAFAQLCSLLVILASMNSPCHRVVGANARTVPEHTTPAPTKCQNSGSCLPSHTSCTVVPLSCLLQSRSGPSRASSLAAEAAEAAARAAVEPSVPPGVIDLYKLHKQDPQLVAE